MARLSEPQSNRHLRDGRLTGHIPGNELPGYDHSVPSGQRPLTPAHIFDSTSSHRFEDEDDVALRAIQKVEDEILYPAETDHIHRDDQNRYHPTPTGGRVGPRKGWRYPRCEEAFIKMRMVHALSA